jgi:hypothetical protein
MGDVFAALEGEDEVIVGVRPSPDKLVRRFAVVSVRDSQKIDGLPSRAPQSLSDRICEAARNAGIRWPSPVRTGYRRIRRTMQPFGNCEFSSMRRRSPIK